MSEWISIIGVEVSVTSYILATQTIGKWVYEKGARNIYAANVHMLMEAYDSHEFQKVLGRADLVTPDGMPLVWLMRLKGNKDQQRVYGPNLMLYVLEMAARENVPVGFFGGSPETLNKLVERMQARYPGLNVVYSHSPPFRALNPAEDSEIVSQIEKSGVRILFIGLGCPKQERWMAEHRGQISAVMLGVGAAFDFHAGIISQAPGWMQKAGLEWLYRFWQEPHRLWKRYLIHNPRFVVLALMDLLGLLKTSSRNQE